MKVIWLLIVICEPFISQTVLAFDLFPKNTELTYNYRGKVDIGVLPANREDETIANNDWAVEGQVKIQRFVDEYIVTQFIPRKGYNGRSVRPLVHRRLDSLQEPFRLYLMNGVVTSIQFEAGEPGWSANFKKAIASALLVHGEQPGAFVFNEGGINGFCNIDYYIENNTVNSTMYVRKTPDVSTCRPFVNGVHDIRSNLPASPCKTQDQFSVEETVVVAMATEYTLKANIANMSATTHYQNYFINTAEIEFITNIHAFESDGESQFVTSNLRLDFMGQRPISRRFDIRPNNAPIPVALNYNIVQVYKKPEEYAATAERHLNQLVDALEKREVDFNNPYDDHIAEIFRVIGLLDGETLRNLYAKFDIGTSYRQETVKNLFLEILPRVGTKSSVVLIQELVVSKNVKPITAVQLVTSLPFYVTEFSMEIVKLCEPFLSLTPDRPDVRDAAVLSYATLIFKTYSANRMTADQFDRYVKRYFELFLLAVDYEQQMLYIQALGNLQLGNVAQYLAPIIRDTSKSTDLRYLAMWATMPSSYLRNEQSYEVFWPLFENATNPIELRITAMTILLISNPSPGRLLSLHAILLNEPSSHLLHFYRTTIVSMSQSTYPCFQGLRRTLSYMQRHLPKTEEADRFWVTGNYIFDYRDSKFGTAGLLQAMLIGDEVADVPYIGYFKFASEALGRVTGQIGLHVKVRGISDSLLPLFEPELNGDTLQQLRDLLNVLDLPIVKSTPLHLEFIMQIEGKTVLSYYLNSTTISNLAGIHFNSIFSDDSHVNMQSVRWPFMIKYVFPTALGTPIDMTLQSTVLSTLRGNVSLSDQMEKTSSEIDMRYSAYSALSSSTYNPFLNVDHSIRREQGVLMYFPINSEVSFDILAQLMNFTIIRPEGQTNGVSIKSRLLSKIEGPLDFGTYIKDETAFYGTSIESRTKTLKIPIPDVGVTVDILSSSVNLANYWDMISSAETQENSAVLKGERFGKYLLSYMNILQLSTIHFGNDKNIQVIVQNAKPSLLDFKVKTSIKEDEDMETTKQKIDVHMAHKQHYNAQPDFEWSLVARILDATAKKKVLLNIKRTDNTDGESIFPKDFRVCARASHEPMVYLETPEIFDLVLTFGFDNEQNVTGCPHDSAKIEIRLQQDVSPHLKLKTKVWDDNECPTDLLKFNPPPYSSFCPKSHFKYWTTKSYYELDVKYRNLPYEEFFNQIRDRISYAITAVLPGKLELLNLKTKFHLVAHFLPDSDDIEVSINDRKFEVPDFLKKFDILPSINENSQLFIDYGFAQQCSVINDNIKTFSDNELTLSDFDNKTQPGQCPLLLLADCSPEPTLAVFLHKVAVENGNPVYSLIIHAGGKYIKILPDKSNAIIIDSVSDTCYRLTHGLELIYPHGDPNDEEQFKLYYKDGILRVHHQHILITEIEFDLRNAISIQTPRFIRAKLCGICNIPINNGGSYSSCTHTSIQKSACTIFKN